MNQIYVSTVNTEDLSDFRLTDSETEEEEEVQQWNSNRDDVEVNPFVENTGPVTDVPGTSSALDFFKLLFKDEDFNRIAQETNRYARQSLTVDSSKS